MAIQQGRLSFLAEAAGHTEDTLAALRPGDVINLADTLRSYIGTDTPELRAARHGKVAPLVPAVLVLGQLVRAVAQRKATRTVPVRISGLQLDARTLRQPEQEIGAAAPTWQFDVKGLHDILVCQIWYDLTSSRETHRIRVCEGPGCGTIFFAGRSDRRCCSHACAVKKVGMQRRDRAAG